MTAQEIQAAFQRNLAPYPGLLTQLSRLLPALTEEEQLGLQLVYAGLGVQDITGVEPELLLEEVRASLLARQELSYGGQIPQELFQTYVLPPRVNNEWLDGSRSWLYAQLKPWVQGKSLKDAALAVNAWCSTQATYTLADDRTIAPLGMCRRGKGRCGEESTLTVAALRGAGIPARQIYSPYWAHCDDNHAWVEFWAEDGWHYLGGCEPELEVDTGWFTSAASRAMLIRALAPDLSTNEPMALVNTTGRYGHTTVLSVSVQKEGKPVAGLSVSFLLVNESRLCPLTRRNTDEAGEVRLEVGLGSVILSAYVEGRRLERLVDTGQETHVTLRWETGFSPASQEGEKHWQLFPPKEQIPPPAKTSPAWEAQLEEYAALRRNKEEANPTESPWLQKAAANWQEIAAFLSMEEFSTADQESLLSTLTEKDFADVTGEALADALRGALPYRDRWPQEVWQNYILAPRVEWEPLLPIRQGLAEQLRNEGITDGNSVLRWMETHLRPVDGNRERRGSALGYLRHGVCPKEEWNRVAAQLCRSLGIPAKLDSLTGELSVLNEDGTWRCPQEVGERIPLTVRFSEPMRQREQFTISRWVENEYQLLNLDCGTASDEECWELPQGAYRLITARRQIDGCTSVLSWQFLLDAPKTISVTMAPDQTEEKLKAAPLPTVSAVRWDDQALCTLGGAGETASLLILAQPGAEPTEHLFQELLELRQGYDQGGWPIHILLRSDRGLENPTLRQVLSTLTHATCYRLEGDPSYELRKAMGIGDARLPLAIVVDRFGRGRYACANYNIRSASTILQILRIISE
jgi:hypothetical protein